MDRSAREVLWIVSACIAMTQMSWGTIVPVLPIYAQNLGASAFQLGVVVASFSFARLLVNIPAGNLATRFDRKKLLVASVLGVFVVLEATALANSLEALIALRIALGLAGGVAITTGQSLIADITEAGSRGRAMATVQGFQLAGGSVGPAVGGLAAGAFGVRGAFLVSGVGALIVGMWALVRLPSFRMADSRRQQPRSSSFSLLADRSFFVSCVVGFTVFFNRFGGNQTLVPLLAYTLAGLTVTQLGLLLSAVTLANLVTVRFVGSLSDAHGRKAVIVPSMLAVGVVYPLYLFSDIPVVFLLMVLIVEVLNGFSGPTPAAYCADLSPPGRTGQAVGVYRTFGDLAGLTGPVLIGLCIDSAGLWAATLVIASLAIGTGLLLHFFGEETVGPKATR